MKIPLTKPYFAKEEEKGVIEVLKSGWHTQGPKVAEMEEKFAKYTESKYAVAISNCTTALQLALLVGGVRAGDEVIVPSFTFIASVNVIIHVGAKPVFIDVDGKTFNLDVSKLEKKITPQTKAIITVEQAGLPSEIDKIMQFGKKHKLLVVSDAACALGSEYKGKRVGSLTHITCFSLHPRKIISTGEGGLLTTNNKKLAQSVKMWRSHGVSISDIDRHKVKKIVFEKYKVPGYNYRLTDMQAAIGIEQLKKLAEILKKRRYLANRYSRLLREIKHLQTPFVPNNVKHNWQSYIVKLSKKSPLSQKQLMQKLLDFGVATRRGVMACHLEPYYKKLLGRVSLPVTEELVKTTISLPLYPQMSLKEQDHVIELLKRYLK